jgi:hypothetical protein
MPAQPDPPRVSGWALAAASVAVLGAGAWWYVAAAPDPLPPGTGSALSDVLRPAPGVPGSDAAVLWQTSERLDEGESMSWSGLNPGERYMLQFTCREGEGQLRIGVGARGWSNEERFPCTPDVSTIWFSAGAGGALRLSMSGSSAIVAVRVTAG